MNSHNPFFFNSACLAICSHHRKGLLFRCTAEKYNQTLPAVFLTKILNPFEHFYYDKFQVSKWISFGRQFLKWHQQILINHYNEFFFSQTQWICTKYILVTVSEIEQHMNHEFHFLEIISGWKIFLEKTSTSWQLCDR